ncbi:zeta toxin family protein [Campylobacter fetus subsp. venerealis]|uniref:Uncharacterized protein conserved in bacteria n=1 Tax=Campylobacter hyointestinalis subsp. hyointestinalis TaxID=91352 RepID=A0A9W5ARM9_CAMHY|nr:MULTISPECIES: zeta toxin family protein [Campylobacter]MBC3779820.1 zeta toxin family protein [Campylobacter fetus subsp. fetus]MBC3783144.1 zeta toxin family protein [Campylobacter fetus subsp. venerealis]MBK3499398.1 zeta toxin family protein [Campylobacter fetus subsp. venerealis]MBK3501299.1 zeta toxin family protein [Campylobacter fetus subsp. venerealis]MBK3503358.1 zeta toxin family protein [Campylobacter fetus subsp. venerealis]
MKTLYIFAGVNGAGKSTFYINQIANNDFYGARINSDEIVKEFGNWKNPKDQNRAGKIALKLRKSYLDRGIDFNLETTLSGHGIVKFIQEAKNINYNITLFYVGLNSVELSKQRVAIRTIKNGHSIDEKVLERRYAQSFENLKKVIPFCDNIYFYDNSSIIENEEDQKLSNLKLVAIKNNGKINKVSFDKFKWFEELMLIQLENQKYNDFER